MNTPKRIQIVIRSIRLAFRNFEPLVVGFHTPHLAPLRVDATLPLPYLYLYLYLSTLSTGLPRQVGRIRQPSPSECSPCPAASTSLTATRRSRWSSPTTAAWNCGSTAACASAGIRSPRDPLYVWTNIELDWEEHHYVEVRYYQRDDQLKVTINGAPIPVQPPTMVTS